MHIKIIRFNIGALINSIINISSQGETEIKGFKFGFRIMPRAITKVNKGFLSHFQVSYYKMCACVVSSLSTIINISIPPRPILNMGPFKHHA